MQLEALAGLILCCKHCSPPPLWASASLEPVFHFQEPQSPQQPFGGVITELPRLPTHSHTQTEFCSPFILTFLSARTERTHAAYPPARPPPPAPFSSFSHFHLCLSVLPLPPSNLATCYGAHFLGSVNFAFQRVVIAFAGLRDDETCCALLREVRLFNTCVN